MVKAELLSRAAALATAGYPDGRRGTLIMAAFDTIADLVEANGGDRQRALEVAAAYFEAEAEEPVMKLDSIKAQLADPLTVARHLVAMLEASEEAMRVAEEIAAEEDPEGQDEAVRELPEAPPRSQF